MRVVDISRSNLWQFDQLQRKLIKKTLWQESTRVPLIIRAPGVSPAGASSELPVSLIDIYPTLLDLCGLPADTVKNEQGHSLDGFSMKSLLENPKAESWAGPEAALTALYKWREYYIPARESYALRTRDWRYIRYENGQEELYDTIHDPLEWTNLAGDPNHAARLKSFRAQLAARIPNPGVIPAQPHYVAKP